MVKEFKGVLKSGLTIRQLALISELRSRDKMVSISNGFLRCPEFLKQNEVLSSKNIRFKAINTTRRGAKSVTECLDDIEIMCKYPNSKLVYGALTLDSASEIIWDVFQEKLDEAKILHKTNQTHKTITLTRNGSRVRLFGVDCSEKQMRKILGQKLRKATIDEAGSMTVDMVKLCYQTIMPTLTDLRPDSWLTLIGTCENIPNTFFQEVCEGRERGADWHVFRWTTYENPFMRQQWTDEINELIQNNPLVVEASWFKTHYLNQWCTDDDLLVMHMALAQFKKFNANDYPQAVYGLGIDLGFNDACSFTQTCWSPKVKHGHLIKSEKESKMDFTDVAAKVKGLRKSRPFSRFIVDGANKQGVQELRKRHGLPLECAEKSDKVTYLRLLDDDIKTGAMLIDPDECRPLVAEWKSLIWKDKDKEKEDPRCENHCSDGALYSWRDMRHYLVQDKPPTPKRGSKEELLIQQQKESDRMREQHEQRKRIML